MIKVHVTEEQRQLLWNIACARHRQLYVRYCGFENFSTGRQWTKDYAEYQELEKLLKELEQAGT